MRRLLLIAAAVAGIGAAAPSHALADVLYTSISNLKAAPVLSTLSSTGSGGVQAFDTFKLGQHPP